MIRTDLAQEALQGAVHEGITTEEKEKNGMKIIKVKITNEEGAKSIGKEKGTYVTLYSPPLNQTDTKFRKDLINECAKEIREMAGKEKIKNVLVVGLGNRNVTADSLGPAVLDKLLVTRHIKEGLPTDISGKLNSLCAIAPGVLGITGIETAEIIKGIVKNVCPSLIIAVDSLASRSLERIMTTIQISDAGIAPGSGVGGKNKALNEKEMGVKVIAIGVPLVVYASTVAGDLLKEAADKLDMGMRAEALHPLISGIASVNGSEMIVTPKEIDFVVDICAKVLAMGINTAVQEALDEDEIDRFLS